MRSGKAVQGTTGTEMTVTERGGLWASLRGKRAERRHRFVVREQRAGDDVAIALALFEYACRR